MVIWTEAKVEKLIELYIKGYTVADCGRAVGVNKDEATGKLNRELKARGIQRRTFVNRVNERPPVLLEEDCLQPEKPKAVPIEPAVIYDIRRTDRHCKWPVGHDGREHLFCGSITEHKGREYCAVHMKKKYERRRGEAAASDFPPVSAA